MGAAALAAVRKPVTDDHTATSLAGRTATTLREKP